MDDIYCFWCGVGPLQLADTPPVVRDGHRFCSDSCAAEWAQRHDDDPVAVADPDTTSKEDAHVQCLREPAVRRSA